MYKLSIMGKTDKRGPERRSGSLCQTMEGKTIQKFTRRNNKIDCDTRCRYSESIIYRTEWYGDDNKYHYCYNITLDNDKGINIYNIACNDGLDPIDFIEWFDRDIGKQELDGDGRVHKELAVIHCTKFRY